MSSSEAEDLKALIKLPYISSAISAVLGLVILVIGVTVFSGWIYAMIMYVLVGIMLLLFAVTGALRLRRTNEAIRAGEICITHGWWIFSTGVGGIMVYVAPFFSKGAPALGVIAAIASALTMILGMMIVIYANKKMKVRLTA